MKQLLVVFILIITSYAQAQPTYFTKSKKAIKYFESALKNYTLLNFSTARQELDKALKKDNRFIDAYILHGEISKDENKLNEAIKYFSKAIEIKPDYKPLIYLRRADMEKSCGMYENAKADYINFKKLTNNSSKYKKRLDKQIADCNFAIEAKKNRVKFKPENLGNNINTSLSEYWTSITADGKTITFTVSNRKTHSQEDLYHSTKINGKWQKANKIDAPINTAGSEGAQSISADGRTMVFTACLRRDSYGSCDLYISYKRGNRWTTPVNMQAPINTKYKESQPSLSADGRTIYFASNRPGGLGKFDIWTSKRNKFGKWSEPVNLGKHINTAENELAPFIHYDNSTLYFSSEGKQGLGGSDLFISRKSEQGKWTEAINLSYPINTHEDEESLVVTLDGKFGFFSSNMKGGYGQKDIYMFELPPKIRPKKTIFIKGKVFDTNTKAPLQAQINISSLDEDSINITTISDNINGNFLCCLSPQKTYAFNVVKKGYLIYSKNIALPDTSYIINIALEPIQKNSTIILRNIFFEYNSYQLKNKSFVELQRFKDFINNNNLMIEIGGHTDNTGNAAYNKTLSTNRAKSVYDFLLKIGVKKNLLTYKGYGSSQPISTNTTDAGRAKNRRIEFKILNK